jgi:hypothetical protein
MTGLVTQNGEIDIRSTKDGIEIIISRGYKRPRMDATSWHERLKRYNIVVRGGNTIGEPPDLNINLGILCEQLRRTLKDER